MNIENFPAIWKVEWLSTNFSNKLENFKNTLESGYDSYLLQRLFSHQKE